MSLADIFGALGGGFIFFGMLLAAFALQQRAEASFRGKMEALPGAEDLHFLGDQLPSGLPARLLDALPASLEVRRCFWGLVAGERVVSFEYAVGWGRQKGWVSAIGLERRHPEWPLAPRFGRVAARDGNWVLTVKGGIYRFPLRVKDVFAQWASLRTTSLDEGKELARTMRSEAGLHIRPRHEA